MYDAYFFLLELHVFIYEQLCRFQSCNYLQPEEIDYTENAWKSVRVIQDICKLTSYEQRDILRFVLQAIGEASQYMKAWESQSAFAKYNDENGKGFK